MNVIWFSEWISFNWNASLRFCNWFEIPLKRKPFLLFSWNCLIGLGWLSVADRRNRWSTEMSRSVIGHFAAPMRYLQRPFFIFETKTKLGPPNKKKLKEKEQKTRRASTRHMPSTQRISQATKINEFSEKPSQKLNKKQQNTGATEKWANQR